MLGRRGFLSAAGAAALDAAVDRPPADLRPVFAVHDHGALSDGVTDDTAAVLAATRAAKAAGGGVVAFGAGTTVMGDLGAWTAGVTYRGSGEASVIRVLPGRTFRITASRVAFEDLTFLRSSGGFMRISARGCRIARCTFREGASDGVEALVLEAGADDAVIDGAVFRRMRGVSIFLDSCADVRVRRTRILHQRYTVGYMACVQMVGAVKRARITDNVVTVDPACSTPLNGIGLAGTDLLVARNRFAVSRFSIEGGDRVTGRLQDNHCSISSTPVVDGLNYGAGISLPKTHRTDVVGNTVDQRNATRNTYAGIELPNSTHCVLRRNTLIGSSHASVGIMLDAATDCIVDRNTVTDFEDGIVVYAHGRPASRNRITRNRVTFTGADRHAGISVLLDATGSANDNVIEENVVRGGGTGVGINVDVQIGIGDLLRTTLARNEISGCAIPLTRRTSRLVQPRAR